MYIGYALPASLSGAYHVGMYGCGFLVFVIATMTGWYGKASVSRFIRRSSSNDIFEILILAVVLSIFAVLFNRLSAVDKLKAPKHIALVGIQMEFPPDKVIPKMLDKALTKNTNAEIFVLSEYTLGGPVPDSLKNWCREHSKFLVVGGEEPAGTTNYYDTAFVVGTNGDIVFQQGKCVPIQFFRDGLPAPEQKVWDSPWGKIGFCVCYDLSYTRVTDELVRQGAQMLIIPTMDVEYWSRHEHELHTRVAPVRAAEYGIPIFRLASSGISQAVSSYGRVVAEAPMPGNGDFLVANLRLSSHGSLPIDRYLAPACTVVTAFATAALLFLAWKDRQIIRPK